MLRFYKSTQSAHKEKGWQLDERHLAKLHRHHHPKTTHPKATQSKTTQSKVSQSKVPQSKVPQSKVPQPQGRGIWLCLDTACHHPKKLGRGFKREADKIAKILTNLQHTQRAR